MLASGYGSQKRLTGKTWTWTQHLNSQLYNNHVASCSSAVSYSSYSPQLHCKAVLPLRYKLPAGEICVKRTVATKSIVGEEVKKSGKW